MVEHCAAHVAELNLNNHNCVIWTTIITIWPHIILISLTVSLQGVQIFLGQLWILVVMVQRTVSECGVDSYPQTHHTDCAWFGISSL